MRFWGVLALAVLGGCLPPTYLEPVPEADEPLQVMREFVLRRPPDFTFRDDASGMEYFVRRYSEHEGEIPQNVDLLGGPLKSSIAVSHYEGELRLDIVTVLDPEKRKERLSNEEEREYALYRFEESCLRRNREGLLGDRRELFERNRRNRADLIDESIHFKESAIEGLKEERFSLNAELTSILQTPGYKAPEGRVDWLRLEILRRDTLIAGEKKELEALKARRAARTEHAK